MTSRDYASGSAAPTPGELAAVEAELDDDQRAVVRAYWERLIERCRVEVVGAPGPTSALLDGTAAERRRRRMERRAVVSVVRALPVRRGVSGPDGRAA